MTSPKLPQKLRGTVTKFKGNGRKLGYPTANIMSNTKLGDGIYFGFASLGTYKQHPALIFIGTPTTLGDKDRRVEAHLLDVQDQDYYDLPLTLWVEYFHRPNQKFASVSELLKAMAVDEKTGRQWFQTHSLASQDVLRNT